jgi:hypothetical protein
MMFCFLYRRAISRSMDTGAPLGGRAGRHVARCPACREFRGQCVRLARGLADDAREITATVSADLHAKILRRCGAVTPAPSRAGEAEPALALHSASARGRISAGSAPRFLLRPELAWLPAAAILLLAVLAWRLNPKPHVSHLATPGPEIAAKPAPAELPTDLPSLSGPLAAIDQALGQRVEDELRLLRNDGKAAADFLLACVPLDMALRAKSTP